MFTTPCLQRIAIERTAPHSFHSGSRARTGAECSPAWEDRHGRVKIPPSFDGAKQKSTSQTEPEEKAARTCRALTRHRKLVPLCLHIYTRHLPPGLLCPVTVSRCPLGHATSLTPVSCDSQPMSTGSVSQSVTVSQCPLGHAPSLTPVSYDSQCPLGHATSLTPVSCDSQPMSTGSRHLPDSCVL